MAGDPKKKEIEITPEMIAAGVKAAEDFIYSREYEIPSVAIPSLVREILIAIK